MDNLLIYASIGLIVCWLSGELTHRQRPQTKHKTKFIVSSMFLFAVLWPAILLMILLGDFDDR